jgi:hypothetical protein
MSIAVDPIYPQSADLQTVHLAQVAAEQLNNSTPADQLTNS